MSAIDAELGKRERAAYLDEIRDHLPAYLGGAGTERVDPAGDVQELLNLRAGDLRRVVAVHLALAEPVVSFATGLRHGLRRPLASTERQLVATQAVRGPIDWAATINARASTGWDETRYVVRPARRVFDIPENRALVWLLDNLDTELRRAAPAQSDPETGVHNTSWFARILEVRASLQRARRMHWLRGIPPERPTARTIKSLATSRTAFYKRWIPEAIEALQTYTEDPDPESLTDLLCRRFFEPERDWRLFELVVALRLARSFAAKSTAKRKGRLLVGTGRAPYARYTMPDGDEIRLWYQAWPHDVGTSLHEDARAYYGIESGSARPDIVIQRVRHGSTVDALLLELKASRNPSTLGAGLLQLLGYLKDRPTLFELPPHGWLVAPPSDRFTSKDAAGRELWVVDSDQAAAAAVSRLTQPQDVAP